MARDPSSPTRAPRPVREPSSESAIRSPSTALNSTNVLDRIIDRPPLNARLAAQGDEPIPLFELESPGL